MTFDFARLDPSRVAKGPLASAPGDRVGSFFLQAPSGTWVSLLVGGPERHDGVAWEHVRASWMVGEPTWADLRFVRALFWDATEPVIQTVPAVREPVDGLRFCVHLWRPLGAVPLPPMREP